MGLVAAPAACVLVAFALPCRATFPASPVNLNGRDSLQPQEFTLIEAAVLRAASLRPLKVESRPRVTCPCTAGRAAFLSFGLTMMPHTFFCYFARTHSHRQRALSRAEGASSLPRPLPRRRGGLQEGAPAAVAVAQQRCHHYQKATRTAVNHVYSARRKKWSRKGWRRRG